MRHCFLHQIRPWLVFWLVLSMLVMHVVYCGVLWHWCHVPYEANIATIACFPLSVCPSCTYKTCFSISLSDYIGTESAHYWLRQDSNWAELCTKWWTVCSGWMMMLSCTKMCTQWWDVHTAHGTTNTHTFGHSITTYYTHTISGMVNFLQSHVKCFPRLGLHCGESGHHSANVATLLFTIIRAASPISVI